MTRVPDDQIGGELQAQIMSTLWSIETGTVDEVRDALPRRYRGAYTTVQTILNRLVDRGLLARERTGRRYVYTPRLSEAEYLSGAMSRALAGASKAARQAALAQFVGTMKDDERDELQRLAAAIPRRGTT
jgi:predicted transcriptional regulator